MDSSSQRNFLPALRPVKNTVTIEHEDAWTPEPVRASVSAQKNLFLLFKKKTQTGSGTK
jgi:hypothetical protein